MSVTALTELSRPVCPSCRSEHVRVTHTSRPVRYMACDTCDARFKAILTYSVHITSLSKHVRS